MATSTGESKPGGFYAGFESSTQLVSCQQPGSATLLSTPGLESDPSDPHPRQAVTPWNLCG